MRSKILVSFFAIVTVCFSNLFGEISPVDALRLVKDILPESPVILEAGALKGEHTRILSRVWPKGRIHAFEPFPLMYKMLKRNTAKLRNVRAYNIALFDKGGYLPFHVVDNHYGANSLLKPSEWKKECYAGRVIKVPCFTLKQWQTKYGIDHIDFFWLDMEGAELQMLRRSPELLKHTTALYIEVNFKDFRVAMTQCEEISDFLKKMGFVQSYWHPYKDRFQADILYTRQEVW